MYSYLNWFFLASVPVALAGPLHDFHNRDRRDVSFASSTTWSFTGTTLPTGLVIDTGKIAAPEPTLLAHRFDTKNVAVADGFMSLTVPGGQQGQKTISCAEVATSFEVLHASVSTFAILTEVPGVCNGMFFYHSDSQESDIEWISDPKSKSNLNSPNGTRAMQYTNQALNGNTNDATMFYGPAPEDATSAVHEYRLDWTADSTKFYVDGVLQRTMKKNVPTVAGPWIWNNWVDGDPFWTVGPPKTDAVLKIQKIVMHYDPA